VGRGFLFARSFGLCGFAGVLSARRSAASIRRAASSSLYVSTFLEPAMPDKPEPLSETIMFNMHLGFFHGAWAVTEASIDYAIGKFLRLTYEEAHLLTAGMEYGRKAQLLRNIIYRGKHPKRTVLLQHLNTIQNESMRNVFAHSYLASDETSVAFILRSRGGSYSATEYEFTEKEFINHVSKFLEASSAFHTALEVEDIEFFKFQHAALSVSSKS
jgi:hypothetical protein